MRIALQFAILLQVIICITKGEELLKNADFENTFGNDNWYCLGCSMVHDLDAYSGQFSGRVTSRGDNWRNPSQLITDVVQPGKDYYFTARVKLLNDVSSPAWDNINTQVYIEYTDDSNQYHGFSSYNRAGSDQGWVEVAGDFDIPTGKAIREVRLYVQPTTNVDFLIDTSSLTEIVDNPTWIQEADDRIRNLRMNDVTINFNADAAYNPEDIEVEVSMTRHSFPFGSAYKSYMMNEGSGRWREYTDFFYDTFNWGVPEFALKWPNTEPERGEVDLSTVDEAVDHLLARNIKVRGHCNFWGKEDNNPNWLRQLPGPEIYSEVNKRLDDIVPHYRGKFVHWDVNNEQLHGTFYEERTGDWEIMDHMFRRSKELDPDALLFLNEYGIVSYSSRAQGIANQALDLKSKGVPVEGIGIQGHLNGRIRTEVQWSRLNSVAKSELPLWITELSVQTPDVSLRAQGYEEAMRLYFSHPSVDGILLWGFWDDANHLPDTSLVDGPNLQPNEAGERFLDLLFKEWWTEATFRPSSSSDTFGLRGYHGNYQVTVSYNGDEVSTQTFELLKGEDIVVEVDLNEFEFPGKGHRSRNFNRNHN